jgi:hypothetical protein
MSAPDLPPALYRQGRVTMDDLITSGIDPDTLDYAARSTSAYLLK